MLNFNALLRKYVIIRYFFHIKEKTVFKIELSPFKKCYICFNESPLKMTKNVFYFILKALFVLKIFKFLSSLFSTAEKLTTLEKKFKIYDVAAWLTNNYNANIANISKSKDNQVMKFCQLIEYNRKFSLEKSYTK